MMTERRRGFLAGFAGMVAGVTFPPVGLALIVLVLALGLCPEKLPQVPHPLFTSPMYQREFLTGMVAGGVVMMGVGFGLLALLWWLP